MPSTFLQPQNTRYLILGVMLFQLACIPSEIGGGKSLKVGDAPPPPPGTPMDAGVGVDQGVVVSVDMGFGVDAGPPDMGQVLDLFPNATVGQSCAGGAPGNFIVLAETNKTCADHANWLESGVPTEAAAFAALPALTAPTSIDVTGTVCLTPADCQQRTISLSIDSFAAGTGATGEWTIQFEDFRGQGRFNAAWCTYGGGATGPQPVSDVAISDISVYQSVKIPIVQNGAGINQRNGPLVGGRPALIRVFVDPLGGFTSRELTARLTLAAPGVDPVVLEERVTVNQASSETVPGSTFNFSLPGDQMVVGMSYSIGIFDDGDDQCAPAGQGSAIFPAQGVTEMGVLDAGGAFKVTLVPIRYNFDGSGRLPDTSQAQLDRYYDVVYGQFPLQELELTVRQPADWPDELARDGTGWGNLLQALLNLRQQDNAPDDVYYYGIFAPAASIGAFCNGGCVAGLGPVPGANDDFSRGAIGLGFTGDGSAETGAHELGHALGRRHAPCGTQNPDPNFPYNGGVIGVWGFNPINNTLLPPDQLRDLMGYCNPTWISDYNYGAIFNRITFVHQQTNFAPPIQQRQPWRALLSGEFGQRWGDRFMLKSTPQGTPIIANYMDNTGRVVETVIARSYALTHTDERMIMIPENTREAVLVKIDSVGILPL